MVAVGVSEEVEREVLGVETAFGKTEEEWRRFIRQLRERGLSGTWLNSGR